MQVRHQFITIAACVFITCSSGHALADDAAHFGGLYIGAGIGALGVNGTETDVHTVPPRTDTFDSGTDWGVMGTVIAGFDFRLQQNIIIGVFTDFDFSNAEFDLTAPDGDRNMLAADNAFNLGGRLGFLIRDNTLLYATGGYTRGNFEFTYASGSSDQYSNRKAFDGWFVGAGVERWIRGPWSTKLEYRFAHYDREQVGSVIVVPPATDQVTNNSDADTHSIRLGINLNLGNGQ